MIARRLAALFAATLAFVAALAPSTGRAADVAAAQLAFIQRIADSFGAAQPMAPTHAYIGALPPNGAPPLPANATIVGSIVRDGLGSTIYADLPLAFDASVAALDAPFASAGYRKIPNSGEAGFTTGSPASTTTYCSATGTLVVRAYPARETALRTHVDVTVSTDKTLRFACGDPVAMRRVVIGPAFAIPTLHGMPDVTIASATSQENGNWRSSQSSAAYAATSWGRVVSALRIEAIDAALSAQLVAGGWTSTGDATMLGAARVHRFTTPASEEYGAGDSILTLVPASPGSYDAFVRLLRPVAATER